jgi:MFS family permease
MIEKNENNLDDLTEDPLFRKVSKKEIVLTILALVYLLATLTIYDVYSVALGLGMLFFAIVCGSIVFFLMPKEKRATTILRDLSKTPTDQIIFQVKNLFGLGCILSVFIGFVLAIFLTGDSHGWNDVFAVFGFVAFFALLLVGTYWFLAKKILPLLFERSIQSPESSSAATMEKNT